MECNAAADSLRGFVTFMMLVGTATAIWMMYDIYSFGKPKVKPLRDRGVAFCPLHKSDRADCDDKHK